MFRAELRVASAFLEFVKTRRADAATRELLDIPGFEKSLDRGMRDIKAGRMRIWREGRSDL
jgi:hypothetical protein